MYFDPLSAWLVTLIANGIATADEKSCSYSIADYHQQRINSINSDLSAKIRKDRKKNRERISFNAEYLNAEFEYQRVQEHIKIAMNLLSSLFQSTNGQIAIDLIVIDLDNQEYIITLLEGCAKQVQKRGFVMWNSPNAEWYKNAAIEARRKKELYAKELEETHILEAKQRELDQKMSNLILVVGLIIFVAFIAFFFS